MAVPVARVHLKVAHAALPALLPTPPNNWKMLPLLPTPPCVAAILPKALAKPGRADSDERWDAHKAKPSCPPSSASPSFRPRSAASVVARSGAGHGSPRKNATSPPPMPGRADSVERWDAHKKAASPASSSSSSSSSGTSSSLASCTKLPISRASSSAERWDVHKKRRPPLAEALDVDDGQSSSTGSNDTDDTEEEEEEILWKPRAMYAGPGLVVAAPEEPSMIPMPTAFLVHVA